MLDVATFVLANGFPGRRSRLIDFFEESLPGLEDRFHQITGPFQRRPEIPSNPVVELQECFTVSDRGEFTAGALFVGDCHRDRQIAQILDEAGRRAECGGKQGQSPEPRKVIKVMTEGITHSQ